MTTTDAPPEDRVVMRHARWDTYERLLADHEDVRSPRFTYDRGVPEVMASCTKDRPTCSPRA